MIELHPIHILTHPAKGFPSSKQELLEANTVNVDGAADTAVDKIRKLAGSMHARCVKCRCAVFLERVGKYLTRTGSLPVDNVIVVPLILNRA